MPAYHDSFDCQVHPEELGELPPDDEGVALAAPEQQDEDCPLHWWEVA
jgi:hypothetical protein